VIGLGFLSFLTPYILQTWLADRINIGGRPGSSLMPPLFLAAFLAASGVVLSQTVHPNFWCLKKLANVVSSPPVLRTLMLYNSVTSIGGLHHNGRGTLISQTLMTVEYWHIATQLLCFMGYAMDRHIKVRDYAQIDHILLAFREVSFISDWTRVCAHAVFINLLDELFLSSPSPPSTEGPVDEEADRRTPITEIVSEEMVPLSRAARRTNSTLIDADID